MGFKHWRYCQLIINGRSHRLAYSEEAIHTLFLPFLRRLAALQKKKDGRLVVFLAAPADTGKTTLALFLERLSLSEPGLTPIQRLGLEGFARPHEELLATLDAEGRPLSPYGPDAFYLDQLKEKLAALTSVPLGQPLRWPVYDRSRKVAIPDIQPVTRPIVLIEGCWLLLDRPEWAALQPFADYRLFIAAKPESLAQRIEDHLKRTAGLTPKQAEAQYESAYRPHIMQVLTSSSPAEETWIFTADGDYEPEPDRLKYYRARTKETQTNFDAVKRRDDDVPLFEAYEAAQKSLYSKDGTPASRYTQSIETARRNILRRLFASGSLSRENLKKAFHLTDEEIENLIE